MSPGQVGATGSNDQVEVDKVQARGSSRVEASCRALLDSPEQNR